MVQGELKITLSKNDEMTIGRLYSRINLILESYKIFNLIQLVNKITEKKNSKISSRNEKHSTKHTKLRKCKINNRI